MKTSLSGALCALALAASLRATFASDDQTPSAPRTSGRVLIYENETTIEGDIELLGGQYRVRRGAAGGELLVQPETVLMLCKDREEAYKFLRHRANLRDPDERLRLARWCHKNGLKKQELEEVGAAVELRPDNKETYRLYQNLQRMMALSSEPVSVTKPVVEADATFIPASVNTESLSLFVTKVQPILMNTCASCHGTGRGGAFHLTRVFEKSGPSKQVTLRNLASTVAQLNASRPVSSPLLVKSVSVHGDMAIPALKGVESSAYRTLEEWVKITAEAGPIMSREATAVPAVKPSDVAGKSGEEHSNPRPVAAPVATDAPGTEKGPAKGTVDPYDPEVFNRQAHPQGKAPGPNQ